MRLHWPRFARNYAAKRVAVSYACDITVYILWGPCISSPERRGSILACETSLFQSKETKFKKDASDRNSLPGPERGLGTRLGS